MTTELKVTIRVLEKQIKSLEVDGQKPTQPDAVKLYDNAHAELVKAKEDLLKAVLSVEETGEDTALSESQRYTQVMLLNSAMNGIFTFSGHSSDATTRFIGQIEIVHRTVSIDWKTFKGAVIQKFALSVYKSLELFEATTPIEDFSTLKKFLTTQFGAKTSIPQRLEAEWIKTKNKSLAWPAWTNGLESKLNSLEAALLEERREQTGDPEYTLTANDVFHLFLKLKLLTELKGESPELYRQITSETTSLTSVSKMAQRCEILKTQCMPSMGGSYATMPNNQNTPRTFQNNNRGSTDYRGSHRGRGQNRGHFNNNNNRGGGNNRGFSRNNYRGNNRGSNYRGNNRGSNNRGSFNNGSNFRGSNKNNYQGRTFAVEEEETNNEYYYNNQFNEENEEALATYENPQNNDYEGYNLNY